MGDCNSVAQMEMADCSWAAQREMGDCNSVAQTEMADCSWAGQKEMENYSAAAQTEMEHCNMAFDSGGVPVVASWRRSPAASTYGFDNGKDGERGLVVDAGASGDYL